jgi:hypothetical protein
MASQPPDLQRPSVHHYLSFLWYETGPVPEHEQWEKVLGLLEGTVRPPLSRSLVRRPRSDGEKVLGLLEETVRSHAVRQSPALETDLEGQLQALRQSAQWMKSPRLSRRLLSLPDLYPVTGDELLKLTLLAHQEADSLVIHWLWFYPGRAHPAVFWEQIRPRLWSPPEADLLLLGESCYLTAVVEEGSAPARKELAGQILRGWLGPDTFPQVQDLAEVEWPVGHLYLDLDGPQRPRVAGPPVLYTVLFYPNSQIEDSDRVGQLVYQELPLLELYRHKVYFLYRQEYQGHLRPALDEGQGRLSQLLEDLRREPPRSILRGKDLGRLQRALTDLAGPYFRVSATLAEANQLHQTVQVNLENVGRALGRIAPGMALALWPEPLARMGRQIEVDLSYDHNLADQVRDAIETLRTQADILEAGYERRLGIIVAILGTALAAGEALSDTIAKLIWQWFTLAPPNVSPSEQALVFTRILVMLGSGLLTWLLITLAGWIRR